MIKYTGRKQGGAGRWVSSADLSCRVTCLEPHWVGDHRPSPNVPVSESFPLRSYLRWLWAFAACLPSCCPLYLPLCHSWSPICPGQLLLWLLPLASHCSPRLWCCLRLPNVCLLRLPFPYPILPPAASAFWQIVSILVRRFLV